MLVKGIWLFVLGVLAVPNLIIAKKPDAKELIAKIAPYQGWIGACSAIWGAWTIVGAVLSMGWIARLPVSWAVWLAAGVVQLILGILLGVGVLKTFIKNPTAVANMDKTIEKMAPKQGLLGIIAICLGGAAIVLNFIHI